MTGPLAPSTFPFAVPDPDPDPAASRSDPAERPVRGTLRLHAARTILSVAGPHVAALHVGGRGGTPCVPSRERGRLREGG